MYALQRTVLNSNYAHSTHLHTHSMRIMICYSTTLFIVQSPHNRTYAALKYAQQYVNRNVYVPLHPIQLLGAHIHSFLLLLFQFVFINFKFLLYFHFVLVDMLICWHKSISSKFPYGAVHTIASPLPLLSEYTPHIICMSISHRLTHGTKSGCIQCNTSKQFMMCALYTLSHVIGKTNCTHWSALD